VGTPCDRADQVDETLSRVPGAIGFVDWGTAGKGLPIGAVQNKTGIFVSVSGDRLKAAAAGAIRDMPDDLRYALIDVPGKASYPIVATIWAVVCQQQPPAKKQELLKFLRWATTDGQQTLGDMNHGPLPPELATRAQQVLEHVE
jgi:ABC-type phosphate transport system substrate-binding protein